MLSIKVGRPDCSHYSPLLPSSFSDKYAALRVNRAFFHFSFARVDICADHAFVFSVIITIERAADWVGLPWLPWRVFWIPTLMTSCND
jgi:hypothetical protein